MQNLDIKKIIIFIVLPLLIIVGYFITTFLRNNNESTSLEGISSFLPFSEGEEGVATRETETNSTTTSVNNLINNTSIPLLRKISDKPVAGMIVFTQTNNDKEETRSVEKIRYIEKATGHIYETETDSLTQIRISNTTIPQIQEAIWLDEQSLIIRYLDEENNIKTFSAKLEVNDLGEQELSGIFLQDNIQQIIQVGDKIFYLLESGNNSIGVIANKQDENRKIIFESPLKEWLISPLDENHINFTTKPAINITGYSFIFNTKTYSFHKVLGNKLNLSVIPNSSSDLLYTEYETGSPTLQIFYNKDKITISLPLSTFPEKCVWGNNNKNIYCGVPDEKIDNYDLTKWYQGTISFSDLIWKIDTETKEEEFLIYPANNLGEAIDIYQPQINSKGDYLLFINKKDFSLWGLKLTKEI